MEALLFTFDSIFIVLMVFMGLRDDRRAPGVQHTSLFRMTETSVSERPGSAAAKSGFQPAPWAEWEHTARNDPDRQPPG